MISKIHVIWFKFQQFFSMVPFENNWALVYWWLGPQGARSRWLSQWWSSWLTHMYVCDCTHLHVVLPHGKHMITKSVHAYIHRQSSFSICLHNGLLLIWHKTMIYTNNESSSLNLFAICSIIHGSNICRRDTKIILITLTPLIKF